MSKLHKASCLYKEICPIDDEPRSFIAYALTRRSAPTAVDIVLDCPFCTSLPACYCNKPEDESDTLLKDLHGNFISSFTMHAYKTCPNDLHEKVINYFMQIQDYTRLTSKIHMKVQCLTS